MAEKLDFVIQSGYRKGGKKRTGVESGAPSSRRSGKTSKYQYQDETPGRPVDLIDRIHAFVFVYDASHKQTFESAVCMINVISELEKAYVHSHEHKHGKAPAVFVPSRMVVGNKKDLRKRRELGVVTEKDVERLDGVKIKEASALTNSGVDDIFKALILELDKDPELEAANKERYQEL